MSASARATANGEAHGAGVADSERQRRWALFEELTHTWPWRSFRTRALLLATVKARLAGDFDQAAFVIAHVIDSSRASSPPAALWKRVRASDYDPSDRALREARRLLEVPLSPRGQELADRAVAALAKTPPPKRRTTPAKPASRRTRKGGKR